MSKKIQKETLSTEVDALIEDTKLLLKTVETQRNNICEGVTAEIKKLESVTKLFKEESMSLKSLPLNIKEFIKEMIPEISSAIHSLNQVDLERTKISYSKLMQAQNESLKASSSRLKSIKEDIEKIDKNRIKVSVNSSALYD